MALSASADDAEMRPRTLVVLPWLRSASSDFPCRVLRFAEASVPHWVIEKNTPVREG